MAFKINLEKSMIRNDHVEASLPRMRWMLQGPNPTARETGKEICRRKI